MTFKVYAVIIATSNTLLNIVIKIYSTIRQLLRLLNEVFLFFIVTIFKLFCVFV